MKKITLSLLVALLSGAVAFAQNINVTGVVRGDDGVPVPGVAVTLPGTNTWTITNNNGVYSISAPRDGTILFSYLGMLEQRVSVNGRSSIDVVMASDIQAIGDVVVTAMGITRSERSLGYSAVSVNPNQTLQRAEPDLMRSLEGKVAGVQILAPSGAAGAATRVTIRGNSSFLGNNKPLYIVDGVAYSDNELSTTNQGSNGGGAYGSGLSTLDPNDIESMNVLKGAAATALYGSRAANGVVLITTKSGSQSGNRQRGFQVTFNASYTAETIAALPVYQNTYGQGSNFQQGGANGSWGARFEPGMTIYMPDFATYWPGWTTEQYGLPNGEVPYQAYPNNVRDLFRTGNMYETSLNVQSTNDRGTFSLTASRLNQDSYIPNSNFGRFSFAAGGNQKLDNGLRVGGNISFSRSTQDGAMYGNNQSSGIALNSLARAFIMPRSWDIQTYPFETPDRANLLANITAQANNPYWAWKYDFINTQMDRSVANVKLGYDIASWLSVDYTFGVNYFTTDRKEVINLGSRGLAGKGRIYTDSNSIEDMESVLVFSGKWDLNQDFALRASVGHNFFQNTYKSRQIEGLNIIDAGVYSINNTMEQTADEDYRRSSQWGVFADASLSYRNWAFLNGTIRQDRSSTLPKNNRSYFYPSISGSIILTDALNLNSTTLDFAKVRLGWAKVGSDADPYYNNGVFRTGSPYMGAPSMWLPTRKYDENLKPEFSAEIETGLDLSLFSGRLTADISLYNRNSTNQIAALSVPASSGASEYVTNFGNLNNKGIEIGLGGIPIASASGFLWQINATYTKNKSEVLELVEGIKYIEITGTGFTLPSPRLVIGQPYGTLYGTKIARDNDGNRLVDPSNGFYLIANDIGVVGDPNPKYNTSLTNTFSYKGFQFNFMLDFQKGGCVWSSAVTDLLGRGVTKDTEDRLGTRIMPGVYGNPTTLEPILHNGQVIPNTTQIAESDLWFSASSAVSSYAINGVDEVGVYDATTLRLREISLGYQFSSRSLQKFGIGSLYLSVTGRNLWFYAPNVPKYTNYDPSINAYGASNIRGIDYTGAPSTKRYGFNLRLTF